MLACSLSHGAGILGNRMLSDRVTGHNGPLRRLLQIGAHDFHQLVGAFGAFFGR
jgi:hypothetical protein